jgi:hypothetical protein
MSGLKMIVLKVNIIRNHDLGHITTYRQAIISGQLLTK